MINYSVFQQITNFFIAIWQSVKTNSSIAEFFLLPVKPTGGKEGNGEWKAFKQFACNRVPSLLTKGTDRFAVGCQTKISIKLIHKMHGLHFPGSSAEKT